MRVGWQVFDWLLLDADWSLNCGNWMWLSASAFFHQYWKVYSPITFGQKYDPDGKYIKFVNFSKFSLFFGNVVTDDD
jgi:cryptochrome